MDFYSNKFGKSGFGALKLEDLGQGAGKSFEKLVRFIRELYENRIESLEKSLGECREWERIDPVLKVMKNDFVTEKFLQSRAEEIFNCCVKKESERTVEMLQVELTKKQSEIFRLEELLFNTRVEKGAESDRVLLKSKEFTKRGENFRDMWENERNLNEKLVHELGVKGKELQKTQEIFEENQRLQRFCEQLESERDQFTIRSESVGPESLQDLKKKFNLKVSAYKVKIVEQRELIGSLQQELEGLKSCGLDGQRENELVEKQKLQIKELKEEYERVMERKLKEMKEELCPDLKVVSEEKFYEVCRQKIELENKLVALGMGKSEEVKKWGRDSEEIMKEWMKEKGLHGETKKQLLITQQKLKEVIGVCRNCEVNERNLAVKKHLLISSLKKTKDSLFLLKSQLSSLKLLYNQSFNAYKAENKSSLTYLLSLIKKYPNSLNSLKSENQTLRSQLQQNSQAFDKLQAEVHSESLKWKQKTSKKVAKALQASKKTNEQDLLQLQSENKNLKALLENSKSTVSTNSQIIKQLREENHNLRAEREEIKKKQALIEEKIQSQSNNFKLQLRNKQLEFDLLKKSINH